MKRILKGKNTRIAVIIVLLMILFAILAKAWDTVISETHAPMTTRAIALVNEQYSG